jgi:hypothetical protein
LGDCWECMYVPMLRLSLLQVLSLPPTLPRLIFSFLSPSSICNSSSYSFEDTSSSNDPNFSCHLLSFSRPSSFSCLFSYRSFSSPSFEYGSLFKEPPCLTYHISTHRHALLVRRGAHLATPLTRTKEEYHCHVLCKIDVHVYRDAPRRS